MENPQAGPSILRFRRHPEPKVRFAVAFALGSFASDPLAADVLLGLASDPDEHVRDWAVFGVGVLGDADSPEIRGALLRCLNDPNRDVREEAAYGLAKRKDERVVPKLRAMLESPDVTIRVAEATAVLLGMEGDSAEWSVEDYQAAILRKFKDPIQQS